MKNEYYVAIDSNGEPYIEHALFGGTSVGRGNRQNVKYLEKIKDGARTRYFYTQDELRAFYNKGKRVAKNAAANVKQTARDKVGLTAKENRDKAQRALTDARARDMAADKIFKVNYQKEQNAKQKYLENSQKAIQARNSYNDVSNALLDAKLQAEEHDRLAKKHKKQYEDRTNSPIDRAGDALSKVIRGRSLADAFYDDFKSENAKAADARVKVKDLERQHKSAEQKLKEAESARDESKKAYDDAYEKTTKDLDKRTFESDYGMKDGYESQTMRNARRAEEEYAKTPLAKIEKAKEKAEDTSENLTKKLKDIASNAVKDIKNETSYAKDKVEQIADNVKDSATNVKKTIDSTINEAQKSQQRKRTAKIVDKADDSLKKWKDTHKRPDDNMYTFSKATGTTVRKNEMYDFYMDRINENMQKLHELNNDGRGWGVYGSAKRDEYISIINNAMKLAEQYSN